MSAFSRVELELVQNDLPIQAIFDVLVKGCWVDESDYQKIVFSESIEFNGGLYDSIFKLTLVNGQLFVESDSPWEMEVLIDELKNIAVKNSPLIKILNA